MPRHPEQGRSKEQQPLPYSLASCFPTKQKGRPFEAVLIGKQIRYLRRIKDISQETLAKQAGVTVGWIGRIERGIHLPNIRLLVKIARALQVKVKDLIPNELV